MNYSLQSKSTCLVSRRSVPEMAPKDRYLPSTPAILSRIKKSAEPNVKKDLSNKWYKEPKIPIQMNSSTLIRMKTNSNAGLDNVVQKESNNQLTLNALTFLKRDRRMSDFVQEKYEVMPKGVLPFDKNSYIKDVFSRVVCSGDNASLQEHRNIRASANPAGDSVSHSATYHRVSALSINDLKTGCNVKYFEQVSYHAKSSMKPETKYMSNKTLENTSNIQNLQITSASESKLNSNLKSKLMPEEISHDNSHCEDDSNYNALIKKKIRKNKKPVVVTCLKNSSVKFVKRK